MLVVVISRPPTEGQCRKHCDHEMFIWSCANHVISVAQEDPIILSLKTFRDVRGKTGYQLVIAHVVDFLVPGIPKPVGKILRPCRQAFLQSQTLEESTVRQALALHTPILIRSASVIDKNAQ